MTLLGLALGLPAGGCRQSPTVQLPPDWPLKQVGLPPGSQVFEGHAREPVTLDDNTQALKWTVFFQCELDYPAARAHLEKQLRRLSFLQMEEDLQAVPAGAALSFSQAYASPDGAYIVVLVYERSAEAAANTGRPDFFTLMVQQNETPRPPGPEWEAL